MVGTLLNMLLGLLALWLLPRDLPYSHVLFYIAGGVAVGVGVVVDVVYKEWRLSR